jgi:hypothetical protein
VTLIAWLVHFPNEKFDTLSYLAILPLSTPARSFLSSASSSSSCVSICFLYCRSFSWRTTPDVFNHLDNRSSDRHNRNCSINFDRSAIRTDEHVNENVGLFDDDDDEFPLTLSGKSMMMIQSVEEIALHWQSFDFLLV